MFGPLDLMTANKHEVYSTGMIPVFERRLPLMLTMNCNQVQITNQGLKVLFIALGGLTVLGITGMHMRYVRGQGCVAITCKEQHMTLWNMVNALADGFKNLESILKEGVTIFQRTPGVLININDIMDTG